MSLRTHRRRAVAFGTIAVLTATLVGIPEVATAATPPFTLTPMPSVPGQSFVPAPLPEDPTGDRVVTGVPATIWPKAAIADVDLTGAPAGTLRAAKAVSDAGLPVRIGRASQGGVRIQTYDHAASRRAGVDGVVVRVNSTNPGTRTGTSGDAVTVDIDYSAFRQAYGGGWAGRLRLVRLAECALTTPGAAGCASAELPSRNEVATGHIQTDLAATTLATSAGTLVALTSGDSSSGGDTKATSLTPSATWSAGGSSGDFTWSYPMRMPPGLGGPAPGVSLDYSAQSTDGRTAAANSQPSWIGEGFDFWPGYIERSYQQCSDDGQSATIGDECWGGDNATLSMSGRGGELVQDTANPAIWRPRDDDGSKVEKITTTNGDDNGEAWLLTTTDGTRYYFGLNRLPGAPAGRDTQSAWTVPIYGDDAAEPCHQSTFAASSCAQGYRWNLDYVVDPVGNTMSLWYDVEGNNYARNRTDSTVSHYIRGGTINHIEYGTRQDPATGNDDAFSTSAPMRVDFAATDRCITAGTTCVQSNPANWPDVPWDRDCASTTNCSGHYSPTFWTSKRLSTVTTRVWGGSGYRDVERWTLNTDWRDPGDGNQKILWLNGISHAGLTPGYPAASVPDVTFTAVGMSNRVDVNDATDPIWRLRMSSIVSETGGVITVAYAPTECRVGGAMPASPETNTLRCFPTYWVKPGATAPSLEYFNRYIVTGVTESDPAAGGLPVTTSYSYLDAPAWHYDDNEFTPPAKRSYGQWRGYSRVRTVVGQAGTTQTQSDTLFFRGMNGDRLPSGTRSASIVDSLGASVADEPWRAGAVREQVTYNGVSPAGAGYGTGAPYLKKTLYDPWEYGPTATRTRNGVTVRSYVSSPLRVTSYTALDGGRAAQVTRATTTTDGPTKRVLSVDDEGDLSTTADDRCVRDEYADNAGRWMYAYLARTETVAVRCADTPQRPDQVISDTRTWYDGATSFDKKVSKGKATRVEDLTGYSGTTPQYGQSSRTSYDGYGRVVESFDPLDYRSTTAYTPATGAVTGMTTVNPMGWQNTAVIDPAWALPLRLTDQNGRSTSTQYDALGRATSIWLPGRDQATQTASLVYSYGLSKDAPTVVSSGRLNTAGTGYLKSLTLYDGLLRQRQTQVTSPTGTGRVITDMIYDYRGNPWKSNASYYNASGISGTLFATADASVPSQTVTTYDSAGRTTDSVLKSYNVEQWRTTTAYGGDRTYTTPPAGAVATTQIIDAQSKPVELRQHRGATPTGAFDATRYTYTARGDLATVTDPAGSVWRYFYDQQGRQIRSVDPDAGTSTMTWDAGGRKTSVTDGRGITLSTEYDAAGRGTSVWQGAIGTGTKLSEWTYDTLALGRLTSQTAWTGGKPYTYAVNQYDVGYRVTDSTTTIPPAEGAVAGSYRTQQTYNPDGSLASTTMPPAGGLPAETISYGYSAAGLLQTMTGANSYLTGTTYDPLGRPVESILSDGTKSLVKNLVYDTATGRLARSLFWGDTTPLVLADRHYAYDPAGNITAISDQLNQFGSGADDNQCFRYDYLRRLTDAWTPANGSCATNPSTAALGGPAKYWQSYGYDLVGDRTSQTTHAAIGDTAQSYAYPAVGTAGVHTLSSVTTTGPGAGSSTYHYDDAGHTSSRVVAGTGQALTWDPLGRLSSVTQGSSVTSYIYDTAGNRLLRHDPGGTTLYLPGQEVHATAAGALTCTRYYSNQAVRTTTGGLSWLAADHQGTTSIAVHAGDMAVSIRRTKPFGEVRGSSGTGIPGEKGFVGGTNDSSTGLVHLGAREYDPSTGRFISVDPVFDPTDPQQLQGYAYAANTPVTASDPGGEMYMFDGGGGGGGGAAAAADPPDLHPKGLHPGKGKNKNIYTAAAVSNGKRIAIYVRVTDGCDYSMGPTACASPQNAVLDVEFLGPAIDCGGWSGATSPCYLGRDAKVHDLDGHRGGCGDGGVPCVLAPQTGPNPHIKMYADLRSPAEKTYPERCPSLTEVPAVQRAGPSDGHSGPEVQADEECHKSKMDCSMDTLIDFGDIWLGPVPVVGEIFAGMAFAKDVRDGEYLKAGLDIAAMFTGPLLSDKVESGIYKASNAILKDKEAAEEISSAGGYYAEVEAKTICAETPGGAELAFCLF